MVSKLGKKCGSSELSGGTKIAYERSVCEFTTEGTENTEIHWGLSANSMLSMEKILHCKNHSHTNA